MNHREPNYFNNHPHPAIGAICAVGVRPQCRIEVGKICTARPKPIPWRLSGLSCMPHRSCQIPPKNVDLLHITILTPGLAGNGTQDCRRVGGVGRSGRDRPAHAIGRLPEINPKCSAVYRPLWLRPMGAACGSGYVVLSGVDTAALRVCATRCYVERALNGHDKLIARIEICLDENA